MNRRSVLQGLATLSFSAAFAGCRGKDEGDNHKEKKDHNHEGSGFRTLRIILMGPFAVIQQKDNNYRIKAYVPYDREHEFRFPSPLAAENKHKNYHFTLPEEGLINSGQPYVDRGFDGFNVTIPEWKLPTDAFVALDLPAPNAISYLPPLEGVLFEPTKQFPNGQFATLPLNHVLEYRLKEECKVVLHSEQLGDCYPLSCDDLYQQVLKYERERKTLEQDFSQHELMDQTLTRCSQSDVCTFFLGVGVSPSVSPVSPEHALNFFNNKLLPSLYGSNIPRGKKIVQLKVSPCSPSSNMMMSPTLVPAVQRLSFAQPRYVPIASTENCTVPGATGTAIRTVQ